MDILFKIAVFLVPFDNLFFAPSTGWATVSPLLFFVYVFFNIKYLGRVLRLEINKVFFISFCVIYSLFLYLFNGINISNVIDSLVTILLGISFYVALIIRYKILENDKIKDLKILLAGYTISFIYGLIKYIALEFNLSFILSFFNMIEKRYYDRVAFSFTEPSFTSIHIFGVLLLIYFFVHNKKLKRNILILIVLFSSLTIISSSSSRFLIDFVVVIVLFSLFIVLNSKSKLLNKFFIVTSIVVIGMIFINIIENNNRMQMILDEGVYGDASLASRYFRVNASIEGYKETPINAIFGAGIGNSYIFLREGYDKAFFNYDNSYTSEVLALKYYEANQMFSLPIRLISEIGFLNFMIITFFLLLLTKLRLNRVISLLLVLWIYIQFDSYAFYSLWLLIFILTYFDKTNYKMRNFNENINI